MFAILRSGGKQYRVAPGDKIVVEKLSGQAGDSIDLTDILLAGEGAELKSTSGLVVAAEIIAQAKADKVTVFKKKRRHNYRRKRGHRQQHTILRILSIGDEKAPAKASAKASARAEQAPAGEVAAQSAEPRGQAEPATETKSATPDKGAAAKTAAKPASAKRASAKEPSAKAAARPKSTKSEPSAKGAEATRSKKS